MKLLLILVLFFAIGQAQPRVIMHIDTVSDVAKVYPAKTYQVLWQRLHCIDTTIRDYWHGGWNDTHSFGYFNIDWKNIPVRKDDVLLKLETF